MLQASEIKCTYTGCPLETPHLYHKWKFLVVKTRKEVHRLWDILDEVNKYTKKAKAVPSELMADLTGILEEGNLDPILPG